MASTFTARLRYEKQADGENSNTWGGLVNTVFDLIDEARAGYLSKSVAGSSDVTLTVNNSATDENRQAILEFTGLITADISVIVDTVENWWMIKNSTTGAFSVTVKTSGGTGIEVPKNVWTSLYCDGTNVLEVKPYIGENSIINGNFDIWERGTSFVSIASGVKGPDRWVYEKSGVGVHDLTRDTNTPDGLSAHSMFLNVTTLDATMDASDLYFVSQIIEGYNIQKYGFGSADATQLTLSFWVRATVTGIYCVSFRNSASTRSYIVEYTVDTTNTWEFKTITLTADTTGTWLLDSGAGLRVGFALGAGSGAQSAANVWATNDNIATSNQVNALSATNNEFRLSRVQVEVGDTATAFNRRSFEQELALAQRYTWVFDPLASEMFGLGQVISVTGARVFIQFPVVMRANPTLTVSAAGDFDVTQAAGAVEPVTVLTGGNMSDETAILNITVAANIVAGNATRLLSDAGGNAKLTFDSEL